MASISSEGSIEAQGPIMEQEDIALLTHDVRNFKEALGRLRRTLNPEQEKIEPRKVVAHERLGEVLRILRTVLEKYPALQSPELLLSASTLIQHLKGYEFDDLKADHKQFFELIDQLALAFSSRVSEYLMGDLDTNILLSNMELDKTKSKGEANQETVQRAQNHSNEEKKEATLELNEALLNLEQGVEFALNRAKVWAKYAKDILMYIEKRCHLEMEYTRNINKLAQTMRPIINEEGNLPFQSIYCTALDYDSENSNSSQAICSQLLGSKFLEPLSERRSEHEKERRQLKEQWFREVAHMHDIVLRMRQARGLYIQYQHDADQHLMDEVAQLKASEAEASYKTYISEANKAHKRLFAVKNEILHKVQTLLFDSDNTLQAVTIAYFQLQHSLSSPSSVQFQTLCESSRLYEPGSQYVEAVKRLPPPTAVTSQAPFTFEKYCESARRIIDQERKSTDSIEGDDLFHGLKEQVLCSDTDSITSAASSHDADTSPSTSCRSPSHELITEIDPNSDNGVGYVTYLASHRHSLSKAAETHAFRKLKTPSRCRECDSYVYFQGVDCSECGLACHKKCLENLTIQCGHKRLPRKMTTFGVDLAQHLGETATAVPNIVCKCIDEIEARGHLIKGIYRVSGVKSRVEKLCQAFENGAELVDLTDIHPNVIANVLKLYLRQLPEPLLTFRLYPEFVRVAKEYCSNSATDIKVAKEELKALVQKLSRQHYLTLALLMLHLKRIAAAADANNMPASNLGIVFGPTLLRTAEGSASLSSLVDTVHQTRAIELLIAHADDIFSAHEVASARESSLRTARDAAAAAAAAAEARALGLDAGRLGRSFSFMERAGGARAKEADALAAAAHAGNASDDEFPYFLSTDGPSRSRTSPQLALTSPTPKIFKGSLRDYQGLEGVSLPSLARAPDDAERRGGERWGGERRGGGAHSLRKTVSDSSKDEAREAEATRRGARVPPQAGPAHTPPQQEEAAAAAGAAAEAGAAAVRWVRKKLGSGDSFSSLDESPASDCADDAEGGGSPRGAAARAPPRPHPAPRKQDTGDNLYIPVLQKQSLCQESSQLCRSKQTIQSKSTVDRSNIEEQKLVAVKTHCVHQMEEATSTNMRKAQQVLSSAVATVKTSSRQVGHCTQVKSCVYASSATDTNAKAEQFVLSRKEGCSSVQVEKILTKEESKEFDDVEM